MNSDKTIESRFSAAAKTYHKHASAQLAIARNLAEMIKASKKTQTILEIGCGTGTLTKHLVNLFPNAEITALDISRNMIEQATTNLEKLKTIRFVCQNAMEFEASESFDLVCSSASLHWITPLSSIMQKIYTFLKPGGSLICSVMLAGTLGELRNARNFVAPHKLPATELPTEQETVSAILSSGLKVTEARQLSLIEEYENTASFLKVINAQGLTGGYPSRGTKPLTGHEIEALKCYYDAEYKSGNGVLATYKACLITALKK
ncbi:MAG: methyltransferase domain-containing protein [Lentisphaerae bacterium]|nr:methyltransferase domain-containing protein [Lentisphaerota bacterium]